MQHRIIVVETRADLPVAEAQRHWRDRHPAVYVSAPNLVGYVQNRPLEEEWERLGRRSVCSETWFEDRVTERASFESDYYHDVVLPDESVFLDRESAWMGRIVTEGGWSSPRPRYRVLAFGAASLAGGEGAGVYEVDRDPPDGGARLVVSVWVDDRRRALELARALGPFAFAAEAAVFVEPPASAPCAPQVCSEPS